MACGSLEARGFLIFLIFVFSRFSFISFSCFHIFRLTLLKRRTQLPGVRVVAPACVAKCLEKRRSTAEMHRKSSHRLFLFMFSQSLFSCFHFQRRLLSTSVCKEVQGGLDTYAGEAFSIGN